MSAQGTGLHYDYGLQPTHQPSNRLFRPHQQERVAQPKKIPTPKPFQSQIPTQPPTHRITSDPLPHPSIHPPETVQTAAAALLPAQALFENAWSVTVSRVQAEITSMRTSFSALLNTERVTAMRLRRERQAALDNAARFAADLERLRTECNRLWEENGRLKDTSVAAEDRALRLEYADGKLALMGAPAAITHPPEIAEAINRYIATTLTDAQEQKRLRLHAEAKLAEAVLQLNAPSTSGTSGTRAPSPPASQHSSHSDTPTAINTPLPPTRTLTKHDINTQNDTVNPKPSPRPTPLPSTCSSPDIPLALARQMSGSHGGQEVGRPRKRKRRLVEGEEAKEADESAEDGDDERVDGAATSPSTNARDPPCVGEPDERSKIGIRHMELLFETTRSGTGGEERLVCRMCLVRKQQTGASTASTTPVSFPANAAWRVLAGHCTGAHPAACAELEKLSAAQVLQLRQRMRDKPAGVVAR